MIPTELPVNFLLVQVYLNLLFCFHLLDCLPFLVSIRKINETLDLRKCLLKLLVRILCWEMYLKPLLRKNLCSETYQVSSRFEPGFVFFIFVLRNWKFQVKKINLITTLREFFTYKFQFLIVFCHSYFFILHFSHLFGFHGSNINLKYKITKLLQANSKILNLPLMLTAM